MRLTSRKPGPACGTACALGFDSEAQQGLSGYLIRKKNNQ